MEYCGVQRIANAEQLCRVDPVLGIEGKPAGLHGPLDGGTSHITGACGISDGELGHAHGLSV
jgi:hypothetical protein